MITAEEGLTHQDKTLLRQIAKNYRPVYFLSTNGTSLMEGEKQETSFLSFSNMS
jgi:hypothetical protein